MAKTSKTTMNDFSTKTFAKTPSLKNCVLIEGLPGIGNVGKVAVDFLIDELKATKVMEISSPYFPHSVFVQEDNLVHLPVIEIYYKKKRGKMKYDLLFMAGDVQPVNEQSTYYFSEYMLSLLKQHQLKQLITLGGIGLGDIPKSPKIYLTGNSQTIIKRFKGKKVVTNLYGTVGPIIGVSGMLVGLASRHNIQGAAMLAETYGHPMYLGIKGARELLKNLSEKLNININIKKLEREIKEIESEVVEKTEQINEQMQSAHLKKLKGTTEMSYIG